MVVEFLTFVVALDGRQQWLDIEEQHWLEIHEHSLDEHIAALKALRFEGDALLEFGEFLRRPARVTARLTWR